MSLRKIAGLLVAFGLVVGLIGGGVAASFSSSLTASQTITVGTFGCIIDSASAGAVINDTKTAVTLDSGLITSSVAGSAPFSFTVKSNGSIPVTLTVTQTTPPSPFSSILTAPVADVNLVQNGTHLYAAGLKWTALGTPNLGTSVGIVYTIACNEQTGGPLGFFGLTSTNAANLAANGPSVTAVDNGSGSVTLNFTAGDAAHDYYQTCFEYVTDGNTPEQRLKSGGVFRTNYLATLTDGMWPFVCVGDGQPHTASVTLTGINLVQVRASFGAESHDRFDWTSFPVAQ